jgi:glyoxylase-like metal-dependent hydrolase (beta-lactamase superfamily II)
MIHRVTRFGIINVFLVEEADDLTLIDTAISGSAGKILRAAEKIGKPITTIALTHGHGDHVGSLDALAAKLPDAEVLISARDLRLLEKDTSLDPGEPGAKVRGGVPGTKTRPTRTIAAGDRVGSLEVIASPGHTPGHVSFLDTRDGTLYAGDAFTNIGGLATTAKGSAVFPLAAVSTWDKPTAVQSARALRALDPARLAFGHGRELENPAPAMDEALARVEKLWPAVAA